MFAQNVEKYSFWNGFSIAHIFLLVWNSVAYFYIFLKTVYVIFFVSCFWLHFGWWEIRPKYHCNYSLYNIVFFFFFLFCGLISLLGIASLQSFPFSFVATDIHSFIHTHKHIKQDRNNSSGSYCYSILSFQLTFPNGTHQIYLAFLSVTFSLNSDA